MRPQLRRLPWTKVRAERHSVHSAAIVARDRKALAQTQKDKYPEQYSPQVEQYLRNLAESEDE